MALSSVENANGHDMDSILNFNAFVQYMWFSLISHSKIQTSHWSQKPLKMIDQISFPRKASQILNYAAGINLMLLIFTNYIRDRIGTNAKVN